MKPGLSSSLDETRGSAQEQITDWSERIFIPDPETLFGSKTEPEAGEPGGPDIDVPVRRKG